MARYVFDLLLAAPLAVLLSCSAGHADSSSEKSQKAEKTVKGPTIPREFLAKNQADKVEEAIRAGADVNAVYERFDATALAIATSNRAHAVVEVLLKNKADPNAASKRGWTALTNSVTIDNRTAVKLLLQYGADVNFRDELGGTALMWAAYLDLPEMAKLLLENKAEVDAKDDRGETALWKAAKRGALKTARLLVERGADVNAKDKEGRSALQTARGEKHGEVVAFLEQNGAKRE